MRKYLSFKLVDKEHTELIKRHAGIHVNLSTKDNEACRTPKSIKNRLKSDVGAIQVARVKPIGSWKTEG
jgi:hypothetical protein